MVTSMCNGLANWSNWLDPMQVTFHRAFDMSADLDESLERVIETGAHRILTSGGVQTVSQGAERISQLIDAAHEDGLVSWSAAVSARKISAKLPCEPERQEFHCSLRIRTQSPVTFRNRFTEIGLRCQ